MTDPGVPGEEESSSWQRRYDDSVQREREDLERQGVGRWPTISQRFFASMAFFVVGAVYLLLTSDNGLFQISGVVAAVMLVAGALVLLVRTFF